MTAELKPKTRTKQKNKPGSQKVTGQRRLYKLLKFLNDKVSDPTVAEKISMQAADRLTELFLRMQDAEDKAADRAFRLEMALLERQGKIKPEPLEQPAQDEKPNVDWDKLHQILNTDRKESA